MKRIYSISKPQLLTLWAFGGIATLWAIDKASYLPYSSSFTFTEFVGWFVPLALLLYTFGWRDHQKKKIGMDTPKKKAAPAWIPKGSPNGFSNKGVKKPIRATYYGKKAR